MPILSSLKSRYERQLKIQDRKYGVHFLHSCFRSNEFGLEDDSDIHKGAPHQFVTACFQIF